MRELAVAPHWPHKRGPKPPPPPVIGRITSATPIIKWAGGKTRLLPDLVARMPTTYFRYFEPFAGGAALFFRTAPLGAVLGDANADLMTLYRQVARSPAAVSEILARYQRSHDAPFYLRRRTAWNKRRMTALERAATFLYLNRTCFNGLWRVNRRGEFNVPMGDYEHPMINRPAELVRAARVLRTATLRTGPYQDTCADVTRGDFIYFDPPYDPVSDTASFTAYTGDRFGKAEQTELAAFAADLVDRGAYVMLSNSDTRFMRRLFADKRRWRIHKVTAPRAINSDATARAAVGELVITGGY